MLKGIKNIIFDLGGVIYAINYKRTIKAFESLGINDFEAVYAKAGQSDLFDNLETGKISPSEFFVGINKFLPNTLSAIQIKDAWNAMLIGFMPDAVSKLKELNKTHRIFLLSNTNIFHIEEIQNTEGMASFVEFCELFEKVYLSHDIGLRKPHTEVFTHIVDEQGLEAYETLFIDDSPQHVAGALKAGLKSYHLKDGEEISQLLP
jgi:putative hydrolase of the HAD superfamily|tara:strand:- start:1841 stop:2455 length:615 start_codon:yes stop_codon:yes gene_type:complete